MSNLCIFKKSLCLLLLAIAICFISGDASSVSLTPEEKLKDLENKLSNANTAITTKSINFVALKSERDDVKVQYDGNAEELRDQAIVAAHQGVAISIMAALGPLATGELVSELRAAILNADLTARDLVDKIRLSKALTIAINKTDELRNIIGNPANGSQEATGLFKTRDDIYDEYLKAHEAVHSPSVTPLDRGHNDAPIDNTSFSYGCFGSSECDDTYGSPLAAMTDHFVQCEEYPHKDQGFGWYSCERDSCAKPGEHKGECGEHKITPATRNNHLKLANPQRCPVTHTFTNIRTGQPKVFQCVKTRRFVCDDPITSHSWHEFNWNPQEGESRVYPPGYYSESVQTETSTPTRVVTSKWG